MDWTVPGKGTLTVEDCPGITTVVAEPTSDVPPTEAWTTTTTAWGTAPGLATCTLTELPRALWPTTQVDWSADPDPLAKSQPGSSARASEAGARSRDANEPALIAALHRFHRGLSIVDLRSPRH